MDTWIIWNLTGGTTAAPTSLTSPTPRAPCVMDLDGSHWDDEILTVMGIPRGMLPPIRPSSDPGCYGYTRRWPLRRAVPVCGDLGDQQAAMVGQACFSPGEAKNTYGTGCFMLLNTGTEIVPSQWPAHHPGYKFGEQPTVYALEGSIAITGAPGRSGCATICG